MNVTSLRYSLIFQLEDFVARYSTSDKATLEPIENDNSIDQWRNVEVEIKKTPRSATATPR